MSNDNPPSGGENQNWTPPPPPSQPQQPYQQPPYQQPPYQQQPQQPPYQQQPPAQPQQYTPPTPAAAPPRLMPQVNMQSINQMIKSVPQLVRALRLLAWTELAALVVFGLISFCSSLTSFGSLGSFGGFSASLGLSVFTSLLVVVLQAFVYWGLLMGVALLLEKQQEGKSGS